MKWIMGLMFLLTAAFGGTAVAFHSEPKSYEVGKVQPFVGLVCKTQAAATHIMKTWDEAGILPARKVFVIYNVVEECFSATTFEAYFIEQLGSMEARNQRGIMQEVLLFSISPTKDNATINYLVTWVALKTAA